MKHGTQGGALLPERAPGAKPRKKILRVYRPEVPKTSTEPCWNTDYIKRGLFKRKQLLQIPFVLFCRH